MGEVGHGASARGVAAADDEVGIAGVGEFEAVADVFAGHELTEVVHVRFEADLRHLHALVDDVGADGIADDVDVGFLIVVSGGQRQAESHGSPKNFLHVC